LADRRPSSAAPSPETARPSALVPAAWTIVDGGGEVANDESIAMVNVVLGSASTSACPAGHADQSADISIADIVLAVKNALSGCQEQRP